MTADVITSSKPDGIELWGGIECTVNRVGNRYFNQLDRTGHSLRLDDLDRAASLGISAIRYPVLWETTAPDRIEKADWSWSDVRLARLRALGVTPIAGLVHHGSGPAHTSLIDPEFPIKLAEYAAAVAERYPWVEYFTPVNEPLTTARFSGLYGLWYPHRRDERSFKDALLTQCRAVVLAMQAIRGIQPGAKLLQTEDLGKTYSTPALAYQADFNNALRWLTWDLLCGRVDRNHFLWRWLTRDCGATEAELLWFQDHRCPPAMIGANHYVTSERFLDENLAHYAPHFHGGNGRHRYADIEAARCLLVPTGGVKPLLQEAWQRYRIPIAITEVHIDSTRDDQMRWLTEMWCAAQQARSAGVDLRALTVWAVFGAYDWNCLVTDCRGYYEPGAFDARGATPRRTAIGRLAGALARDEVPNHPVLSVPGWWRRPGRFWCSPAALPCGAADRPLPGGNTAPVLITGGTGTLGRAFARLCRERGLNHQLVRREDLDIAEPESIERVIERIEPWAIINAAGYVRVDDAEGDVERCFRENTTGPTALAAICARHALPLVTFSSDLVFDGARKHPYVESDGVAPLNVYGRSKAEAEMRVLDRHPASLVIRTSAFFGPWDEHNYIAVALRALREKRRFAAACDLTVSPTYVPDLVNVSLDLMLDGESGVWHLSNAGGVTWADLARRACELANVDAHGLDCCQAEHLGFIARRPTYSVLGSGRCFSMPSLENALERYVRACQPNIVAAGR